MGMLIIEIMKLSVCDIFIMIHYCSDSISTEASLNMKLEYTASFIL